MKKRGRLLIVIGIVMLIISFSLVQYNKYEDKMSGVKAKVAYEKIQKSFEKIPEGVVKDNEEETEEVMKTVSIDGYDYIGTINIPILDLELPIMSDWDYKKMKISPCRYYGSIVTDDLVICAHAYNNLFGNIKYLKQGDLLILTDINKTEYVYEVKEIEILSPSDVKEMIESEFDLTLYTCTSNNLNRITVRLNKVVG